MLVENIIDVTKSKVKLTLAMIVAELHSGMTVEQIAAKYERGQWAIRYQLRKHGYKRIVRWEPKNGKVAGK